MVKTKLQTVFGLKWQPIIKMSFFYFNKQKTNKQTNRKTKKMSFENQKSYSILSLFYRQEKEDNDRKVRDFKHKIEFLS